MNAIILHASERVAALILCEALGFPKIEGVPDGFVVDASRTNNDRSMDFRVIHPSLREIPAGGLIPAYSVNRKHDGSLTIFDVPEIPQPSEPAESWLSRPSLL